jgi:hypothetical protein
MWACRVRWQRSVTRNQSVVQACDSNPTITISLFYCSHGSYTIRHKRQGLRKFDDAQSKNKKKRDPNVLSFGAYKLIEMLLEKSSHLI